jgi:hypothetical protein
MRLGRWRPPLPLCLADIGEPAGLSSTEHMVTSESLSLL